MLSKRTPKQTISSMIALMAFTLLSMPLVAQAEECLMDSDCAEGEFCELISAGLVPCSIDEEGNEICDEVEETEQMGFCQERPIECETDADCPSHLSCAWGGGIEPTESVVVEPVSPEDTDEASAEEIAIEEPPSEDLPPEDPEPVEEGPMMCVFIPAQCASDNDCGMNFHCETYSVGVSCGGAAAAPCQEGEDCPPQPEPDCVDEEFTEGYCMPDEIECGSDDMCPTDWRCREIVESDCGGVDFAVDSAGMDSSESSSSGSSDEGAAPDSGEAERRIEPVECVESARSLCVPVGLSVPGGAYDSAIAESGEARPTNTDDQSVEEGDQDLEASEPSAEESGSSDEVEESGGCDASQTAPTAWALLALLATLGLRRRFI
jgi:hypothetical protein